MFTSGFYELWTNYHGEFCIDSSEYDDHIADDVDDVIDVDDDAITTDCYKSIGTIFSVINKKDHENH